MHISLVCFPAPQSGDAGQGDVCANEVAGKPRLDDFGGDPGEGEAVAAEGKHAVAIGHVRRRADGGRTCRIPWVR